MRYVIVDLEATCWPERTDTTRMEIVEIGAVLLPTSAGPPADEFARFVRPVASPTLSAFCTELTSIRQEDVDRADYFWTVFPEFLDWIGPAPFALCSWGAYDLNQFRADCHRHGIPFPAAFERHVNLKREFVRRKNVRPCGLKAALDLMKMPLAGRYNRATDDARNIAQLATLFLPTLEAQSGWDIEP